MVASNQASALIAYHANCMAMSLATYDILFWEGSLEASKIFILQNKKNKSYS